MQPMQLAAKTQDQLAFLQQHGGKILWSGGGEWIVEIRAERCGQSTFRFSDGAVFNPHEALSSVLAEARTIRR